MTIAQHRQTRTQESSRPATVPAKDWPASYVRNAAVLDLAVALLAGLVAFVGRFGNEIGPGTSRYVAFSALLPIVWALALTLARTYETRFFGVGPDEFRRVLNTGIALTACVAIASYATKSEVARGYVLVALPLVTLGTLAGRYFLRKRLHRLRRKGRCMHRTVAAGHADAVADLVRQLQREPHHGMEIVGACVPPGARPSHIKGVPVLGDFNSISTAADSENADTVTILASPEMHGSALRRLAWQLERNNKAFVVSPGLMDVAGPRTSIRPVAGLPLLHVEHPELVGSRHLLKSVFDRLTTAAILLLLMPLLVVIGTTVRMTSPGPALFRQARVGKNGEVFTLYKFRTMCAGAETRQGELSAHNEHDGVLFKMHDDPRVTLLGRWLRRYSLDELPQLVNVLTGQMSLVGPRPPVPAEVAQYGDDVRRRLVVKPGLTGLWQISGRADLSWEESVRLDLRYVENWSLTMDLIILWKTGSAVIRAAGAY